VGRLKRIPTHWVVPTTLAMALVAALFISPALGGPSFITKKKVVRTIAKKTRATQLVVAGAKPIGPGEAILGTLELTPGNYLVRSTFTINRDEGGQVRCNLRIVGVAQDTLLSSQDTLSIEDESAAMETAGRVSTPTQAQLACSITSPAASVSHIEITALKVPKLTLLSG
jgi:hypothetical protein